MKTKNQKLSLVSYSLFTHWASYLINGDASGLTEQEAREINEWFDGQGIGACLDVSEDSEFRHYNDASRLGGMVSVYTFPLLAKA